MDTKTGKRCLKKSCTIKIGDIFNTTTPRDRDFLDKFVFRSLSPNERNQTVNF